MKELLGPNPAPEWVAFLNHHLQTLEIKSNALIFREGMPVEGLYSVLEGKAKVMQKEGDEDRLVRLVAAGDVLGHRGFGGNWKYPISAVALVPTTLEFLPLSAFDLISKINASFVYNLMMFFAEELRISEERKLQLPVMQRIAKSLLMNYEAFGFAEGSTFLSYSISRKDIASHAGTTYESVVRALADLNKRETIHLSGKAIGILDLARLRSFAEFG